MYEGKRERQRDTKEDRGKQREAERSQYDLKRKGPFYLKLLLVNGKDSNVKMYVKLNM